MRISMLESVVAGSLLIAGGCVGTGGDREGLGIACEMPLEPGDCAAALASGSAGSGECCDDSSRWGCVREEDACVRVALECNGGVSMVLSQSDPGCGGTAPETGRTWLADVCEVAAVEAGVGDACGGDWLCAVPDGECAAVAACRAESVSLSRVCPVDRIEAALRTPDTGPWMACPSPEDARPGDACDGTWACMAGMQELAWCVKGVLHLGRLPEGAGRS